MSASPTEKLEVGSTRGACLKALPPLVLLETLKRVNLISSVVMSLDWLPVAQQTGFKIILLVYKILNGPGPKYISDLLHHHEPLRPLRSSGSNLLPVIRVKTKHSEATFSFYALNMWKKLAED